MSARETNGRTTAQVGLGDLRTVDRDQSRQDLDKGEARYLKDFFHESF